MTAPRRARNHSSKVLKVKTRTKDGKTHRYWRIVESRRVHGGRTIHRDLLYLGELNDAQHVGWIRTIDALGDRDPDGAPSRQLALFPLPRGPRRPARPGLRS